MFKKRTKQDVKSKKKFFGIFGKSTRADGKKRQSGVTVTFNDGDSVTLLNPSGKAGKYAEELKLGKRLTNDGKIKTDKDGNEIPLTEEGRRYRMGYIRAQSDNAKAFNAKGGKK